jgi:hypothetical protein
MDNELKELISKDDFIPFIGMGVFKDTVAKDGASLPYDSDSMILALNNGRAMSPRLMYEYTRAAMSIEQRKGREYLVNMTNHIYTKSEYDLPYIYKWLQEKLPKYVVDTTMDDSLQKIYADTKHYLITGISRITAEYDRFIVYEYDVDTKEYKVIDKNALTLDFPILFKPMGSTIPEKNFIVSDADFVDWLTEAMGGYGMPDILKEYRKGKSYLFVGMQFSKDTYRMVGNEITLGLEKSVALIDKELTKKEKKFLDTHNIVHISADQNILKD